MNDTKREQIKILDLYPVQPYWIPNSRDYWIVEFTTGNCCLICKAKFDDGEAAMLWANTMQPGVV